MKSLKAIAEAIASDLESRGFHESRITDHGPGLGVTVALRVSPVVSVLIKPKIGRTVLQFDSPAFQWEHAPAFPEPSQVTAAAVAGLELLARMPLAPRSDGFLETVSRPAVQVGIRQPFDQTQATAEGWLLANEDTREPEIQRDDEAKGFPFATDEEAVAHVRERAAAGSAYHQEALRRAGLAVEEKPARVFNVQQGIGKSRHVVNYSNGTKTHADGSRFYDLRVFGSAKDRDIFIRGLKADGYTQE